MAIKKTSSSKPKSAGTKKASASKSKPKTLSGPKKSPAKKAAIRASSATVKKLEAKGRAASTGAKKKAPKTPVTKAPRARKVPELAPRSNPEARTLAERAAGLALEKKAGEVVVIDVCGRTGYTDYLVVGSGETERQVSAIAEHVEVTLKREGHRVISAEGHTPGQWVLLDYGDVIVHLFTGEARPFYDLEGMWPDAPRETLH